MSILSRYLEGRTNAAEQDFLYAYYELFQADRDVMLLLKDEEKLRLKLLIKKEIDARIDGKIDTPRMKTVHAGIENAKRVNVFRKAGTWAGIAAAIATVVFGIWFFDNKYRDKAIRENAEAAVHDIAPGRSGATIRLANGKVIKLSGTKRGVVIGKGGLTYDDGSNVNNGSDVNDGSKVDGGSSTGQKAGAGKEPGQIEQISAETSRAQTYEFTLPDGTHVWLNADSKISFPSQFPGKERKILLEGEAYFVVVHNAKQPFRVLSYGKDSGQEKSSGPRQVVEDIGTEFNINAYADESNIKTTLIEGSAKVNAALLAPGQQAVLDMAGQLAVRKVNTAIEVAWKEGNFMFEDESIEQIMNKVARWYDVAVQYQGEKPAHRYNGVTPRAKNVSQLLSILEATGTVHFKIEGRTITVSK